MKTKEHIQYHKDGSIWAKGSMLKDTMHGYWQWFRKDGTILRSGYFDKGKQTGQWVTYTSNGKPYKVTVLKNAPSLTDEKKAVKKTERTRKKGHTFYKSSHCPTCPVGVNENKPATTFLSLLAAPARRALENRSINTVKKLSAYTEQEILTLHGIGKATIPVLKKALKEEGLRFAG